MRLRAVNAARRTCWVLGVFWLCIGQASAVGSARPLAPAEEMELRTLTGQLADSTRSPKTRMEAASLLLTRSYPQAADALRDVLARSTDRSAQIVVADAIAQYGGAGDEFIEPLMAMLTGKEATIRAPAARALVTYKDQGVTGKLVALALDARGDKSVRLVVVEALQGVLDKQAVDALVRLLDDPDAAVCDAALASLAKLTNIRAFGKDRAQWKGWWRRNKDKDRSEWLADLAESLGRAKAELEAENVQLQKRLVKAMQDLYAATPVAQRDALILSFLGDPLGDVRQVGLTLTDRKIATESVSPEIRLQVRAMLADPDEQVRRAAAILAANLADPEALDILQSRLRTEDVPEARQGILTALGQYGDPRTLPAVTAEIASEIDEVSAAAATALAKIAAAKPPDEKTKSAATGALVARYRQSRRSDNGEALREALLLAMGVVGDGAVAPVLEEALKDPAATVRLAAVNGLAKLGWTKSSPALEPLVDDGDRGVRRAAIAALSALGGAKHLPTILKRTAPKVETDAAVRQQAWDVAMGILAKADAATLASVAASLAERPDAIAQRIQILERLVDLLRASKGKDLPGAERDLGLALLAGERPAEAAGRLASAWTALAEQKDPAASAVWLEWVDALLAAADPLVLKALADPASDKDFAEAMKHLDVRLAGLMAEKNYPSVVLLAGEAVQRLSDRLTESQKQAMEKTLEDARAGQLETDRQNVSRLVGQLTAADEAVAAAASAELRTLSERAIDPLLEELRKVLEAPTPAAETEKAILAILRQVAPNLVGYDLAAPGEQKRKVLKGWVASRSTSLPTGGN